MMHSVRLTTLSVLGLLVACSSSDTGGGPVDTSPSSGGAQSGGASSAIGGATGVGGARTTGGVNGSGGASTTGGVSMGGSVAATGGANRGGASTGGAVAATGGANRGGASTGGAMAATGGANRGGASTGGAMAATGGANRGGAGTGGAVAATGGANRGGAGTGGSVAATGGASTGGSVAATGGTTATGDCPVELVGWATTTTGTTGGGNATPVVVTTLAALTTAVSGNEARVVHLSGTVDTGSSALSIGSNKTLRGVDKNAKIIGGIGIKGQSNIIIQNLTVQGKGQGNSPADAAAASGSHHLWFDHLNILDGGDGILDITNGSDRASISWCKFWYTDSSHDHRLAVLLGNGSEVCDLDGGKNNHTIHHNWFSTLVDQRMPRLLFGKGHVFNNYYNSPGNGYCVGSGSWASILVENNYFKGVNSPHKFQDGHPSFIEAKGNVYDQTTGSKDTGLGGDSAAESDCEKALPTPASWTPSYSYKADAADSIPTLVQKCAGPQ